MAGIEFWIDATDCRGPRRAIPRYLANFCAARRADDPDVWLLEMSGASSIVLGWRPRNRGRVREPPVRMRGLGLLLLAMFLRAVWRYDGGVLVAISSGLVIDCRLGCELDTVLSAAGAGDGSACGAVSPHPRRSATVVDGRHRYAWGRALEE